MHVPTAPPFWLEIIKLVIGPLIAAIVVILGLIWRDRIERRNAAQSWFEQTYITEGIDVLITTLSAFQSSLAPARRQIFPKSEIFPFAPHVLGRMEVVVPSLEFLFACTTVEAIAIAAGKEKNAAILNPKELTEVYQFIGRLLWIAEHTRLALLKITVRSKKEVYDIRSNPLMVKVRDKENQFMNGETLFVVHRRLVERVSGPMVEAGIAGMTESEKELWRRTYQSEK